MIGARNVYSVAKKDYLSPAAEQYDLTHNNDLVFDNV